MTHHPDATPFLKISGSGFFSVGFFLGISSGMCGRFTPVSRHESEHLPGSIATHNQD